MVKLIWSVLSGSNTLKVTTVKLHIHVCNQIHSLKIHVHVH